MGRPRRGTAALPLALAAAALQLARAAVEVNLPFQVVRPSANHASMTVVPEGLAKLAQHAGGISLVSVVGPYHSGKSFLLNTLLRHTQVFSVGSKTSPETMGIWLCRTNLTASDGTEVWLMDSEGFFGPGVDESYDAKVFAVASLVGAHVVYNTVKVIDQQSVGLLEMLVQRAQLFKTRTQSATTPDKIPDFLRADTFPPLTWVVEDFVQDLPSQMKDEGATGWLRTYLDASKVEELHPEDSAAPAQGNVSAAAGRKSERSDFLRRVYRDVRVHTLFLPATGRDQLRDLSKLPFEQLTPEFREEVGELRRHILRNLRARTTNGVPMSGSALAASLHFLVQGLQQGMFHELPSLWNAWTLQVVAVSLNDADAWFGALLDRIDAREKPVPVAAFNDRLDEARENATSFYLALLRDFTRTPQVAELRKRMDTRTAGAVAAYHERVRRWVAERAAKAKEEFASFLSSVALPVNPSAMDRDGAASSEKVRSTFAGEFSAFASLKSGAALARRTVAMPVFTPDPVTQLANDLRAQLGARSMENEPAIQQMFKLAIAAVEEAIVHELSPLSGTLISKARMDEVRTQVEKRCWDALDNQLSRYPWAKGIVHYKSARALLKTEQLEARLSSFAAANAKRLAAHFGAVVERALAGYAANRSTIFLPAAEEDVDARHTSMAAGAKLQLRQAAGQLTDTEAFAAAVHRLGAALAENQSQLKDKNVELWKAHSDEATRCAVAKNKEVVKRCGFFCMYNSIPWYHKSTARRHLSDCFGQSEMGQQMAAPLRSRVFEMWYAKDFAREASSVSSRFTLLLVLFVALFIGCLYLAHRRRGPTYGHLPQGYYNPSYGVYGQPAGYQQSPPVQPHSAGYKFAGSQYNAGSQAGGLRHRSVFGGGA